MKKLFKIVKNRLIDWFRNKPEMKNEPAPGKQRLFRNGEFYLPEYNLTDRFFFRKNLFGVSPEKVENSLMK